MTTVCKHSVGQRERDDVGIGEEHMGRVTAPALGSSVSL